MESVNDERRHEAILGQLFPDEVRVPTHNGEGSVAQVSRQRCPRTNRLLNVFPTGVGVADADDYSLPRDLFDEARRSRPLGCDCEDADVSIRRVLKSAEFV